MSGGHGVEEGRPCPSGPQSRERVQPADRGVSEDYGAWEAGAAELAFGVGRVRVGGKAGWGEATPLRGKVRDPWKP